MLNAFRMRKIWFVWFVTAFFANILYVDMYNRANVKVQKEVFYERRSAEDVF